MTTNTIAIASLPNLPASAVTGADILPIVDTSDLTDPGGTTKGVTVTSITQAVNTTNATFNVVSYGAKVDGSTNDTAALAAAINAASVNGGGIVQLAAGTMLADPPATFPANVTIQGEGIGVSVIQALTVSGGFFVTDHSNVTFRGFSFYGLANNGTNNTVPGIRIFASTVDVTGIVIDHVAIHQTKSTQGAINVIGNGNDGTNATFWVRSPQITNCLVDTYYDQTPTNLGVGSYGIYAGYGVSDTEIVGNYIDGSFGKHGIASIGDNLRMTVAFNNVLNCGLNAPSTFFGYGILAYSGTGQPCYDTVVTGNHILRSNRAGVYFQGVGRGSIVGNTLELCDFHSPGLGQLAAGAISINENRNDIPLGPISITGNVVVDPGGVAINVISFLSLTSALSPVAVVGNSCRNTVPATALYGIAVAGSEWIIDGNVLVGFAKPLFLQNTSNGAVGNGAITNNVCNLIGTTAGIGVTATSTTNTSGPVIVSANQFTGGTTGIDLRTFNDLIITNNLFSGVSGANITLVANRGIVNGNLADSGTNGVIAVCVAGDATAKIVINGNVFALTTTPYSLTPASGNIYTGANDSGNMVIPGALTVNSAVLLASTTALTNGAAAAVGTLTNAPTAGNPTKWVPINDNGTTRYIPAW